MGLDSLYFNRKKTWIFCLLTLLIINPIFSQTENPWVFVQTQSASLNIQSCSIKIQYPKVKALASGMVSFGVTKKINKFLKKEFQDIKKYENEYQCNRNPKKNQPAFHLEIKFEVKLNHNHLLSIYYYAVGYTAGALHPDNEYKAFSFDLRTGNRLLFADLFRKPSNYMAVVNKEIFQQLKEMDILSSQEEFAEVQKPHYDFYLTNQGIVIINLYEVHVLQSVEANLKYEKLKKVLNQEIFNLPSK